MLGKIDENNNLQLQQQFLSSHTDSPQESNTPVSEVNLEPITDTAKASWCHSQGCIIQSALLNQHPNVFLFVKTPHLFECISLWQSGNLLDNSSAINIACKAALNYERSRRELMRVIKENMKTNGSIH